MSNFSPLESRTYSIAYVTFNFGAEPEPEPPAVSRPIAVGTASKVVLLPPEFPPSEWQIERLDNGKYHVKTLGNFYARPAGRDLVVVENNPFEWEIRRTTRRPPPVGDNNFNIVIPTGLFPENSWVPSVPNPDNASQEDPVLIQTVEFPSEFHIFPFKS